MNTKTCDFVQTMLPKTKTPYETIFSVFRDKVIDTNRLTGLVYEDLSESEAGEWAANYEKLVHEEGKEIIEEGLDQSNRDEVLDGLLDVCVTGYMLENLLGRKGSYLMAQPAICVFMSFDAIHYILEEKDYMELLLVAQETLCALDVDLEGAIQEVLNSNLSKFPSEEGLREILIEMDHRLEGEDFDTLIVHQEKLIESEGRYTGVKGKKVVDDAGVSRVVFWSTHEYGKPKVKYVKPCTFLGPVLSKYWN